VLEDDDSKRAVPDWGSRRGAVFPKDLEFVDVAVDDVEKDVDGRAIDIFDFRLHRNTPDEIGPRRSRREQSQATVGVDLATAGRSDLEGNFLAAGKGGGQ
jgi:hypothetical protein